MIRIESPEYEKKLRNLCNCSNGKPRSNPWDSYHYPNCPYLKAMDEKTEAKRLNRSRCFVAAELLADKEGYRE